ncbi:hypothetical protein ES703_22910 [subsurface metagenome]
MKTVILTICLVLASMAGGCCSIMSGDSQRVAITSSPLGATVTTEDGVMINTPGVLTLKRKEAHTLTAEMRGYVTQSMTFEREWNGWLWANLLWDLGIFTWPIDFGTGSAWQLKPKAVDFKLIKAGVEVR